jgi:AcrR family transcriptional regulator
MRRELLDAAGHLFADRGLAGVSAADIARAAFRTLRKLIDAGRRPSG